MTSHRHNDVIAVGKYVILQRDRQLCITDMKYFNKSSQKAVNIKLFLIITFRQVISAVRTSSGDLYLLKGYIKGCAVQLKGLREHILRSKDKYKGFGTGAVRACTRFANLIN